MDKEAAVNSEEARRDQFVSTIRKEYDLMGFKPIPEHPHANDWQIPKYLQKGYDYEEFRTDHMTQVLYGVSKEHFQRQDDLYTGKEMVHRDIPEGILYLACPPDAEEMTDPNQRVLKRVEEAVFIPRKDGKHDIRALKAEGNYYDYEIWNEAIIPLPQTSQITDEK